MAELKAIISADSSKFDKEIDKVEKELKKLESQKATNIKLGVDVSTLDKNISSAKTKLEGLKTSMSSATTATTKFNSATANGGNTLMQFSRIAQDAPFGIMGIGNNITATAEAFGNLSKSSGGAGNALKAVASSMLGTGGILLAVSLVTTGLTYMSQNGITVGDVFDKLTGKTNEYAKSLKQAYATAYEDKGVQEAITNVNELRNEIELAKNGFISKTSVVKHYNDTIGKTTGLVKSIDEAEKALVKNGDAYVKMTLYKAVANAALEEASKQLLESEKVRQKKLSEFTNAFLDADTRQIRSKEQYDERQKELLDRQKKRQREEIKINTDAAQRNIDIAKKFQQDAANIAKGLNFNFFQDNSAPKKAKAPKAVKSKGYDFEKGFLGGGIVAPGLALESPLLKMDIQIDEARVKAAEKLKLWETDFANFATNIDTILRDGTTEAMFNLADSLGQALANGQNVFDAVGASLIGSLGQMMSALGKEMIKFGMLSVAYGNVVAALKKAFTNPYVAVAAGLALTAIGAALSASSKKIASGGSSGGGGGSTSGRDYSSPASSVSSSGGGGFTSGSVVFEISGNSLIGVLSNTLDKNSRLGGSLGI